MTTRRANAGPDRAAEHDAPFDDDEGRNAEDGRKRRLMSASLQTTEDRQNLRRRQRQLGERIAAGEDMLELEECRRLNNRLWRDVEHTKEAAIDSDNVGLIAEKAKRQAEKLVTVPRYDAVRLAQQLAKKGSVRTRGGDVVSNKKFNWHGLGVQVGVCFDAVPSRVSFLYGPLDADYVPRERKKPTMRRKWDNDETGEVDHPIRQVRRKANVRDHELSAVQRNIKAIRGTMRKRSREQMESVMARQDEYISRGISQSPETEVDDVIARKKAKIDLDAPRVDATKVLFDRNSFTKTVENMYNFSFLIFRGKKAGIGVRNVKDAVEYKRAGIDALGPGPVVYPVRKNGDWGNGHDDDSDEDDVDDNGSPTSQHGNTQAVLSLNMAQWRQMCKIFDTADVPHQGDAQYTAAKNDNETAAKTVDGGEESAAGYESDDNSSPQSFAAAVTPEKKAPPSKVDYDHQRNDEGSIDGNAKLGVDNPVIRNPFYHSDNNSTGEQFTLGSHEHTANYDFAVAKDQQRKCYPQLASDNSEACSKQVGSLHTTEKQKQVVIDLCEDEDSIASSRSQLMTQDMTIPKPGRVDIVRRKKHKESHEPEIVCIDLEEGQIGMNRKRTSKRSKPLDSAEEHV